MGSSSKGAARGNQRPRARNAGRRGVGGGGGRNVPRGTRRRRGVSAIVAGAQQSRPGAIRRAIASAAGAVRRGAGRVERRARGRG